MTAVDVPVISPQRALTDAGARQLANATKTKAQLQTITPRWLVRMLPWTPVEAGIYRLNRVINPESVHVACPPRDESELPTTYVGYDEAAKEIFLNSVATIVDIHTRVSDLYSSPYDQIAEQLRLTIETVKEKQESELINNADYGLIASAAPDQRMPTLAGPPTPDDLDQLITRVWKEPAFFMTHPLGIAAFGRECTRRGVPPVVTSLFGAQFITWRGVPIIPTDKLAVTEGKDATTSILLVRTGLEKQGVVGLFQPGVPGEIQPSLSVRFMGIDLSAVASYLVTLYCSVAVHTHDALAALHGVEVDHYHDYQ